MKWNFIKEQSTRTFSRTFWSYYKWNKVTSSCPLMLPLDHSCFFTSCVFFSKRKGTTRMFLRTFSIWHSPTWTFLLSKQKNTSTWVVSKKGITAVFFLQSRVNFFFPFASWKFQNVLHEQNPPFSHSCASSNKNTRTWDVLWKEDTAGFVLEAWRSKANSENVLKNVLQLTKVSFLASLQWKYTHIGCFMKGGNICPWLLTMKQL